jgi:hypothetical protein
MGVPVADPRFQQDKAGQSLSFEAGHWHEGNENDGSAGREFDVPAGAVTAQVFSSVAAFGGQVAEAALDIAGAGFNAFGVPAGGYSIKVNVSGKTKLSVKAVSGNLGVVTVTWGGDEP